MTSSALPHAIGIATRSAERWLAPLADLFARIILFRVFFFAGWAKVGNWQGTLQLFEFEYQVPLLPPELAALAGTAVELGCSTLLLLGLASRLAALPLIGLTAVIQFVLGAMNPAYDNLEHFLWLALLLHLVARGAGPLSLDRLIARRFGTS